MKSQFQTRLLHPAIPLLGFGAIFLSGRSKLRKTSSETISYSSNTAIRDKEIACFSRCCVHTQSPLSGQVALLSMKAVKTFLLVQLVGSFAISGIAAQPCSAQNEFIQVSSQTPGVINIVTLDPDQVDFEVWGVNIDEALVNISAFYPWELRSASMAVISPSQPEPYTVYNVNTLEYLMPGDIRFKRLYLAIQESEINMFKDSGVATFHVGSSSELGELEWSSSPAGIFGTGNELSVDTSSVSAGEYLVSVHPTQYPDIEVSATMRIIDVSVGDEDIELLRGSQISFPVSVFPESANDLITLNLSGFDNKHWLALYDTSRQNIDVKNLIQDSDLYSWVRSGYLDICASLGDSTKILGKTINFKKYLPDFDKKTDALLSKLNFADFFQGYLVNGLSRALNEAYYGTERAEDWKPDEWEISTTPFETMNILYDRVDNEKLDLVFGSNFDSNLSSYSRELNRSLYVVNEDWDYDLSAALTADFKGGSLVLKFNDSGISFSSKTGISDFVDKVSTYGFSSQLVDFEKVTLSSNIHADGQTAWGDISFSGELRLQFSQDVDSAHTVLDAFGGHFDLVFGVGVLISFPVPETPMLSPKRKNEQKQAVPATR